MNKTTLLNIYPELKQLGDEGDQVIKMLLKDMKKNKRSVEFYDNVVKKTMKGSGVAGKLLSGIAAIKNKFTKGKKNPDFDYQVKPGENHAVIQGEDGFFYRDRFAGPGTVLYDDILELKKQYGPTIKNIIKNADKFSPDKHITLAGLRHDVAYALSGQEVYDGNEDLARERVKRSDRIFLGDINPGKWMNKIPAGAAIKIKSDIIPFKKFLTVDKPLSDKEIKLYNEVAEAFGDPIYKPMKVDKEEEVKETPKEVPKEAPKEPVKEEVEEVKPVEQIQQGDGRKYRPKRIRGGCMQCGGMDREQRRQQEEAVRRHLLEVEQYERQQHENYLREEARLVGEEFRRIARDLNDQQLGDAIVLHENRVGDNIPYNDIALNSFLFERSRRNRIPANLGYAARAAGQYGGNRTILGLENELKRLRDDEKRLNLRLDALIPVPRDGRGPYIMEAYRNVAGDVMDDLRDVEGAIMNKTNQLNLLKNNMDDVLHRSIFSKDEANEVRAFIPINRRQ